MVAPLSGDLIESSRSRLSALDARLASDGVSRLTLSPTRPAATSLVDLFDALRDDAARLGVADALADGLFATGTAILAHFPDNILWDLDALAAGLMVEASESDEPRAHLTAAFDEVCALHALFGRDTPIRFRYIHDFVYGFDWAKWVRRDPSRRSVRPFDRVYLRSMLGRGGELIELIAQNDSTYPRLEDERPRNPFRFSREPSDELRLYRDLATRDLVPVRAWELRPRPVWDRPFAAERERRAAALLL